MRLTTVIFIASLMQVSAATFGQRISINKQNAPLESVLKEIRSQSGYDFFYDGKIIPKSQTVDVSVNNVTVADALQSTFKGLALTFEIKGNKVLIKKKESSLSDQKVDAGFFMDLEGTVLNERGQGLPGATIVVMGTDKRDFSREKGKFLIMGLSGTETLITSYVGYKTDTLQLTGQKKVVIRLKSIANTLSEVSVINTGYQTLSKERATGSFGKPNMEIFKSRTGTNDIMGRLEGLVPGLRVIPGAAGVTPGGTRQSVVRGNSSIILSADPLYVVNGVTVKDLSSVNPDDVADITVLKDAAAAAIWGVQASNGVIVITTKKGNPYQKLSINYSGYLNFQAKPNLKSNHLLSSSQYIQAARETFNPVVYPFSSLSGFIAPHEHLLYGIEAHKNDPAYVARANASLDSLGRINNQDQILDLWYQNAVSMNHTLSVSGGSELYNVYTSVSYANGQTTARGATNNSYRVNFNQSFNPLKILKISLNTALTNTISGNDNSIAVGSSFLPYQLFKDGNGNGINLNYTKGMTPQRFADYSARSRINLDYFPLDEINDAYRKTNALNLNVNGNVNLKIWRGLSFDGTYGYQRVPEKSMAYDDIATYRSRRELLDFTKAPTTASIPVYLLPNTGGRYQTTNNDQQNWTLRNQLIFNANPRGGKDNLNIQIGQEAIERTVTQLSTTVRGYNEDLQTYQLLDYPTLSKGVFDTVTGFGWLVGEPFSKSERLTRNTSLFGLFSYTYDGKYTLDASWRKDKSNVFASDISSQKKPTYSIGGRWRIKNEKFMQPVSWVNNLGLRATYGITGNSPYLGAASLQDILGSEINSVTGPALRLNSAANTKLGFERTRTINIGIDFSIFNDVLSGGIDLYDKKTTDMLGQIETNPLGGTSSTTGNLGTLFNKGIELSLTSTNINKEDFGWTTGLVFSYNKNKLGSYTKAEEYLQTDWGLMGATYVAGYSLSPLFAYRFAGLDNMGDPQIKLADGTVTKKPEVAKAADLVYMGSATPTYGGGLTNTVRYKSFSLSANMVYSLGGVMRRPTLAYSGRLTADNLAGNKSAEFVNRWKKAGDEAFTNIPSYIAGSTSRRDFNYYTSADINVIDASYIKLRDVTLTYRLSPQLLRAIKVSNANLFVQSGNYMIWKANHYHVDPENALGYINGRNGLTFSVGANVTF